MEKLEFLQTEFVQILASLPTDSMPTFGKMNLHQMIEHMTYSFRIANGRIVEPYEQSDELTAKMKLFMMSDKPFKDNTPNQLISEDPVAPKHKSIQDSLAELQSEINEFVVVFNGNHDLKIRNPFFGELNYDEWIQLLYKHSLHHLRQFGFE